MSAKQIIPATTLLTFFKNGCPEHKSHSVSRPWKCLPLSFFAGLSLIALAASAQAQSSVTLAWNGPTNTVISGYRVYQGTASRVYNSLVNAGVVTQKTMSSLTAGATYYFALTDYDAAGVESDYSSEISYTVPGGTNSPPPTNSIAPVITLTSPAGGSAYAAPANINLAASVTPNGHTPSKVQFYQGSTLLGESLAAPYSYLWSGAAAGAFSLSAKVIYDGSLAVSCASSTITVTNSSARQSTGLVAAYGFEEGGGGTVSDSSGSQNAGSINGATWTTAGRFGKGLSFNGAGAAVVVNDSASLDLTSGMTLEAWVYPTGLGYWDEIIYKGDDAYFLEAATPLTTGPSAGLGNTSVYPMLSALNPLPQRTWTHVATTYDGATLRLYVNGVLAASRPQTGPIATSGFPLTIGADTLHGTYFAGVIDEVRIYNRALAAAEVQTDMNSPVSAGSATPAPPAVTLNLPANGSSFAAPANLTLATTVTANGHTITKVQFYNGSILLGEDLAGPFNYTWNNTPAGSYSLKARIVYDGTLTVDSTPVNITVTNPLPSIAMTSPASGSTNQAPAALTLAAAVTANGHAIAKVQFFNGSNLLGEAFGSPYTFTWLNVPAGSYTLSARLIYDGSATLASSAVSVTVRDLPLPWDTTDIGTVGAPGSVTFSNGIFTANASGSFNSTYDDFRFLYQPLSGDGQIIAQITSAGNGAYAGAMIRESLASDSSYVLMGTANDKMRRQSRDSTGRAASMTSWASAKLARFWVRLVRAGDVITRYQSADGVDWNSVDSLAIPMASEIYIGLAVASDGSASEATATFSNVSVVP